MCTSTKVRGDIRLVPAVNGAAAAVEVVGGGAVNALHANPPESDAWRRLSGDRSRQNSILFTPLPIRVCNG